MILHLDDITHYNENSAGGSLYFSYADTFFPEEAWYDLVSADLERWVPALISFGANHSDMCNLEFMDGPYCIRLMRQENNSVVAKFYDSNKFIDQTEVDILSFLASVTACCRKFDRSLYENGFDPQFSEEIHSLKGILDRNI
jgi:hypothetical protein